ncbi:GNAT family N-acetyltransferase [Halomonas denitrificans]|nr:GNAT family N-acetyltransferase [Halomonas denitrificans]
MSPGRGRGGSYRFERFPLGRPWCEAVRLDDGRRLLIRPIEPADADRLRSSFRELTPAEIRFRFFHPIKELSPEFAKSLSTLDPARAFALVVTEARPPNEARIGAVARAAIDEVGISGPVDGNDRSAEFALTVGRELGGVGLGRYLLTRIIEWCRKKRLAAVYGRVMVENERMLELARQLGFDCLEEPDAPGVVHVRLRLSAGRER